MTETLASMGTYLATLVEVSLHAGVLVLLVLAAQCVFNRWLSPRGRYALWGFVVLRLLLPAVPGSPLSIWNLLPDRTPDLSATQADLLLITPQYAVVTPVPRTVSAAPRVPPVPAVVAATPSIGFNPWLLLWTTGAALILARALCLHVRLHLRLKRDSVPVGPALVTQFERARRLQNIRRPVRLTFTDAVSTPALVGVFRPAVLLPPHLVNGLTSDELDDVLAHEFTHLRHHDVAANWLLVLLTAVHWFNPLVWLAVHRLKTDREAARDADAIKCSPRRDPRGYARTLIRVMELMQPGHHPPTATGMSLSPRALQRRVQAAAQGNCRSWRTTATAGLLAILLTACGLSPASSQAPPQPVAPGPTAETSDSVPLRESNLTLLEERHDLSVRDLPFIETIAYLRQQTGLQIEADWRTLEAAGLGRDTPVSLWIRQVEVGKFLDLVLQQVSSANGDTSLAAATVAGDVVQITLEAELYRRVPRITRSYNIQGFLNYRRALAPDTPESQDVDEVIALIQETVGRRGEWDPSRNPHSTITFREHQLNVYTTDETHRQVAGLLEALSRAYAFTFEIAGRVLLIAATEEVDTRGFRLVPTEDANEMGTVFKQLGDLEARQWAERLLARPGSREVARPRLSLFNGQTGHLEISPAPNNLPASREEPQDRLSLSVESTLVLDRPGDTFLTVVPELALASPTTPRSSDVSDSEDPAVKIWKTKVRFPVSEGQTLAIVGRVLTRPTPEGVERLQPILLLRPVVTPADKSVSKKAFLRDTFGSRESR